MQEMLNLVSTLLLGVQKTQLAHKIINLLLVPALNPIPSIRSSPGTRSRLRI